MSARMVLFTTFGACSLSCSLSCSLCVHCVFTACSLRVHCDSAEGPQRGFERPVRSPVGPFPSPTELNAVESSSDQLSPARTPVAAQSSRARARQVAGGLRARVARARHGCARQVGSHSWVAGAGDVAGRDRGSRAQSAGCGSLAGHRGCLPARRVPRKMSSRSVPQPPLVSELAFVGPPSLPLS